MARVNHKQVKQLLNEKRSKITDRQLFSSRILAGSLEDIAAAQTRRYKYNRRIRVQLKWKPKDPTVAYTNNQVIHINSGNPMVTSEKGRENRYNMILGLFAHEVGHVLYTDFLTFQTYLDRLANGKWYPIPPVLASLTDKVNERDFWEYVQTDEKSLHVVQYLASQINNIIEDGYVENRVLNNFPGKLGHALEDLREKHFSEMPTVTDLIEKENDGEAHIFESIMQLMLSYAKFGEIKYGEEPLSDERIQTVFDLIGDIDEALLNRSGKERLIATNAVLIRCWPQIKEYCDYCKQRYDDAVASGATGGVAETLSEILGAIIGGSAAGSGSSHAVAEASGGTEQSATAAKRQATQKAADKSKEGEEEQGASGGGEDESEEKSSEAEGSGSDPNVEVDEGRTGGGISGGKQDVTSAEGGRIPYHQTESVETEGEGLFETDADYQRERYEAAASDIEKLLEKMAERAACTELENNRLRELNDAAQSISYGNVHEGINVRVNRIAEVDEELVDQFNLIAGPLMTISRQLQRSLVRQLKDSRRGGKQTGLLIGRRLDSHTLHRNDGKVFYKNALPNEIPELAVGLLIDESGSMGCGDRCTYARASAIILYDFCRSLGIPVMVYGHTTGYSKGVDLFSYAEFESYDNDDKYRMMDIGARNSNRDGAALRFVAERLSKRQEDVKLLILISDGQPADWGYSGTAAEEDLRGIKKEYQRKGILFVAAAIGDDKQNIERIYGDSFLDITDLNQLPVKLTAVVKRHIRV